ncbi:MAG: response regulator [Deltaproteobacteria bacterium]|nr:response regulator [Deltaproteobacteria bacterium]
MSDPVTYEMIFQLFMNLTQIRESQNITETYLSEWNNLIGGLDLEFVSPNTQCGDNCLDVSTEMYKFGNVRIGGNLDNLPTDTIILLSKSTRLLAILLENRMNEKFLLENNIKLERSVRNKSQELHSVEDAYKELTNSISDIFIAMDREFIVTYWNKIASEFTGISSDNIIGESIWKVFGALRGTEFENQLIRTRVAGKKSSFEMEFYRDGSQSFLQVVIYPFQQGFSMLARDVTSMVEKEKEHFISEQKRIQEQKIESLAVMAGGVAHDFNNLLNVIIGHSSLLLNDVRRHDPSYEDLQAIEHAAKIAAGLSRQMLDYSGRGKISVETIELNAYLRELKSILILSSKPGIGLSFIQESENLNIEGDPNQIRQLLTNLLVNAIESIDGEGTVIIRTGRREFSNSTLKSNIISTELPGGTYIYIEVTDTGCGIESSEIDRIFDPFYSTKFTGRGLGLSAVLGIVRGHNGGVIVSSEKNKGSTFTIIFPECLTERTPKHSDTARLSSQWFGSGTILFVDDEKPVRRAGEKLLKRLGFNVLLAADGLEAIDIFERRQTEISLVILDMAMPGMGGLETMEKLREIRSDIKIVLSSGFSDADSGSGLEGVDAFLPKPYGFKRLAEILKKLTSGTD